MKTLAAAIVLAGVLHAGPSLRGRVLDSTDAVVPNSDIDLVSARDASVRFRTRTDSSGTYVFDNLAPGDYLVEGRGEGFGASGAQRVTVPQTTMLDLRLAPASVATQIEVTASATPLTAAQISRSTDILDRSYLDRMARTHVTEAVQFLPGLRVQRLGGPGAFTRVLARGLRAFDTAVLVDGFRLRDAASTQGDASAFLGDLLIADPDRIEVLRGAGAALYGTHASGAVINIVSNQGGGPFRGDIGFEGGGLGVMRGTLRGGGSVMDNRLQLSAGIAHLNVTKGLDGNDRHRNGTLQASAAYQLAPATRLSARVIANDSFTQLNITPYALPGAASVSTGTIVAQPNVNFAPAPDDPDARRASRYATGLFAVTHSFTPRTSARVGWQTLATSRDNRDGPGGPRFQPMFNSSTLLEGSLDTLQTRVDTQLGRRNQLSVGHEFERERFDNRSSDQNPNPALRSTSRTQARQITNALFAHNQLRLLQDRLQLSLSGRYQHFALDRPTFSGGTSGYEMITIPAAPKALTGDVSIAYFVPSTGTKMRAHVGNGFRSPSLYERFGTFYSPGFFSGFGDPRLRPERLLSTEAGIDQYLAHDRVRIRGTYFYTRIQESIIFSPAPLTNDPFGRFSGYVNSGGGISRGLELSVDANPSRGTMVQTSYTFTNADERQGFRSLRIPDHSFTARASQAIGKRLEAGLDVLATSSYLYPFFVVSNSRDFSFRGPARADIAVNYTVPLSENRSLRFFTRAENVLNVQRFEDGFPTPKAWAVFGMKFFF